MFKVPIWYGRKERSCGAWFRGTSTSKKILLKLRRKRVQSNPAFVSATFDMQSVLQLPSGAESLLYYKRKLVVHNRTIYEAAAPNKGYCYLWPENAGKKEDQLKSDLCSLNIVQILCLENLSRPKNIRKVALTCWFSQCYNTRILNAKLLLYYFTYLLVCFWDTVYMLQHQQSMLLFWLFDTPRSIYNCSFKYFTYRVA